jgi:hypothetical protein
MVQPVALALHGDDGGVGEDRRGRALPAPTAGLAGGLILWNLLFMAQYGLGLLPYEAPVSLAAVARNQWIVHGVLPPMLVQSLGALGVFLALCGAAIMGWLAFRLRTASS